MYKYKQQQHKSDIDLCPTGLRPESLRPRKNAHYFADDIFNCISLNQNFCILIKISVTFVLMGIC